jgi:hypothetical protein
VAVVAGIPQEGGDGWRRGVASQKVLAGDDGRVLVRRIGKLQSDEREQTEVSNPLKPLFHSLTTSFWRSW